MAVSFDDAVPNYLEVQDTPITAPPFTMACWAQTDDVNIVETMMSIASSSAPYDRHMLWLENAAGDPVCVMTGHSAKTTTGVTVNVPFHACGVWAAVNDRRAYINGGSKGTDNWSEAPSGIDRVAIGRLCDSTPSSYWSGKIWEAAIWDIALMDEEVAILAKGFSPLFVRPQNLVAYWPLHKTHGFEYPPGRIDRVGGYHFTNASGYPSDDEHGKILYPTGIFVPSPKVIAGIVRPLVSGSLATGRKGLVA